MSRSPQLTQPVVTTEYVTGQTVALPPKGEIKPLNEKHLKGLIAVIWLSFIIIGVSLGFLIYLVVEDTRFKNLVAATPTGSPPPAPPGNYKAINLTAIIFGSVGAFLLIVLVALTGKKRYVLAGDYSAQLRMIGKSATPLQGVRTPSAVQVV